MIFQKITNFKRQCEINIKSLSMIKIKLDDIGNSEIRPKQAITGDLILEIPEIIPERNPVKTDAFTNLASFQEILA